MTSENRPLTAEAYSSRLIRRQWLTKDTFILALECPSNFRFTAGQRIRLSINQKTRDYSLIPGDSPNELLLLIRLVADGPATRLLSTCPEGISLQFTGPGGQFIDRSSSRPAVFVATGTGIAPFVAMVRAGTTGFTLLHGARVEGDLYFRDLVSLSAEVYIPCLTTSLPDPPADVFAGRATTYAQTHLPPGDYDFYLAGRREMIADMIAIIDDRFPSSRIYSEIFF